jgi:phenylacetyl-CoA:acceptor oxidoreductase subunit 2
MHEEIGTEPGFYYLYGKADATPGRGSAPARSSGDAGKLRTRGVEPWHQQHWDWKAAGNFIFGGFGTGLFLFAGLVSLREPASALLGWPALALVALGLFLVLLKIGRPLRFIYVLRQPGRSWMTREAWIAAGFFPLGALASWMESPMLMLVAAALGGCFLFSQAMILREAKGIPAWRSSLVVPLILATGLAEGSGLFLAATVLLPSLRSLAEIGAAVAVMTAALRGWTWRAYLTRLRNEGAPLRSIAALNGFGSWLFAFGLVLPTAAIIAGAFVATVLEGMFFLLAGLGIAGAGGALKFILVTHAGYNQGFALVHTPMRGVGNAGAAVKPGW